jgi:HEAT repeat protein
MRRNYSDYSKVVWKAVWLAIVVLLAASLTWAQLSIEDVITRLKSTDLRERANALMMLREPGASAAIPALIQMLSSEAGFPAGRLLVWNDLPRTRSCDPNLTFGGEAAETIADIGVKSDELLSLLASANSRIRANAARALGGLKDKRAIESLLNFLSTPDEPWQVRGNAAIALGLIGDARAVRSLIAMLQDDNPDLRRAAAMGLGEMKDPGTLELLVKMLNDPEPDVRDSAVIGIGRIGGAAAFEPLSKAALHDKDPVVRESATNMLIWIKDPRSLATFAKALQDSYTKVSEAAIRGLGQLNHAETVDSLIRMLSSDEPDSRQTAAVALGEMRDGIAVNPIINMLIQENSRDWNMVVLRGLKALSRLGNKRAAEMLKKYDSDLPPDKEWWDQNKRQFLGN